jgi:starch synthase
LFLLSNASVFDRLYQPVFCDEQLRRAIALSRGALELLVDPQFGIRPSILVSNDWMTATIPPLMALDPRYRDNTRLSTCKTIHMIHNGGADYHGRLPTHVNDEDLWPLLGLAPEHFFGFRDPFNSELLNVTTAAAHHASGAILTVSQRYAEELTTPGCGDGLGFILSEKKERVFGISNAILHSQVETFLCRLANLSDPTFGSLHDLVDGKLRVRSLLQEKFGLRSDPHAKLLSVVGRLAEQKGLKLLSGIVSTSGNSVLEEILVQNPEAQIIVAGPSTEGDREAHYLMDCLSYLTRRYPGRISAYLDYVPHAEALQIIFGSTFFLMPSRFEPGGITQLEALAAGTLVIGRRTGGIAATIENYCEQGCSGNGFLCDDFDPTAFFNTAQWAFKSIRSADTYRKLVANCTQARHNWSDRLPMYRALFQHILLGPSVCAEIPWVKESIAALDRCRVAS